MKKGIRIALISLIAVLSIGISGCGIRLIRSVTAQREASDDAPSTDTAGHPAGKGADGAADRAERTETVWPGVYALDGDPGSEIFVILTADGKTVEGWYLYETASGGYGMNTFAWDISADDTLTATGPFGNGSDLTDTYRLQNDRITVTYPDGWWPERDYLYLCAPEDAGEYVTNPAFEISMLDPDVLSGDGSPLGHVYLPGTDGLPETDSSSGTDSSGTDAAVSQPFYGIWVLGSHDLSECREMVGRLREQGFADAAVFYTTDWSNLNTEPWYVVTTGCYVIEDQANAALPSVRDAGYEDAYVKYSGERQAYDFAG